MNATERIISRERIELNETRERNIPGESPEYETEIFSKRLVTFKNVLDDGLMISRGEFSNSISSKTELRAEKFHSTFLAYSRAWNYSFLSRISRNSGTVRQILTLGNGAPRRKILNPACN